jgi:hypothetical protein
MKNRKKFVFLNVGFSACTLAMSVTSEKAAKGLSHREPSKDHDDHKITFPCVYVCV